MSEKNKDNVEVQMSIFAVAREGDGVILQIVQELPLLPLESKKALTDEDKVAKKMYKAMQNMAPPNMKVIGGPDEYQQRKHSTVLWFSLVEYMKLGKPTVGDQICVTLRKIKDFGEPLDSPS